MGKRTVNLTFHGVGEPQRPLESGEDRVWLHPGQFLAVLDSVVGRSDVQITFDDGNTSDLEHALPALQQRGLTATFFVIAGRLGAPGFLDARDIRALAMAGMTIGCHGMHHLPWSELDEGALREELVDAKLLLEKAVSHPVTAAACPFGAYDRRVLRALRRHGYRHAYTSDRGTTRPDDWVQPRNTVRVEDGDGVVEQIVAAEKPLSGAIRRRMKLAGSRWR